MSVKKSFILSLFFFISVVVFGQKYGDGPRPTIGKITGTVVDNKTKQTIEFATVGLFKSKDSTLVTGAAANNKGQFELSQIEFGKYFMKINFIGYKQLVIDTIKIRPGKYEIALGTILLHSAAEQLGEVEIASEKSTIQLGIDKKIFNVEKSIVSEGGNANDVLQSIPSVSVDIDGNVSLRGSGNVTVLVDGRPSGITGSSRAAILQQIPASSIESIELITNPSAKYSPDGMSGIINIVMKKNKLNGFNGSVSVGAGTDDKYNASAAISYRNKKLNVYGNYGFRSGFRYGGGFSNRQNIFRDTTYYLNSTTDFVRKGVSNNAKAGIDFYLDPKNTLGFSYLINTGTETGNNSSAYSERDNNNVLAGEYNRDEESGDAPESMDYNMNYRRTFNKPKQELTFDITSSNSKSNQTENYREHDYTLKFADKNSIPVKQNTTTKSINKVTNIQLDYTHPLKNQMKIETGAKTIMRNIDNSYVAQNYDYTNTEFKMDTTLNNRFNYKENIYSGYITFSGMINNFGYQLGLRAEQANTTSELITTGEKFENNYSDFFPSLHLAQKFGKENEVQLSYSRRINRPNIRSLNPFKDVADPYNVRSGNPYLKPEYIDSYELSYMKYWKKTVLTSSLYYRKTNGLIGRIKSIGDSTVSYISFLNLNSSSSYGFELIAKNDITKWWNTTSSVNVFETVIDGSNVDADLQNNNFSYIIKLLSNMRVWKNMDIQFTGNYNGPTATAQGEVKPILAFDFGMKKEVFNNGYLSLNINDLTNARKMSWEASGANFTQTMERRGVRRSATVTFTYMFGKVSEANKKSRKDRQGNGGDNDSGGGDMGM